MSDTIRKYVKVTEVSEELTGKRDTIRSNNLGEHKEVIDSLNRAVQELIDIYKEH